MNEELLVNEEVNLNAESKGNDNAAAIALGALIGLAAIGVFEGIKYGTKGVKTLIANSKAKRNENKEISEKEEPNVENEKEVNEKNK